ncbi:putative membrane protein [Mycobacterium intracellulare 1956]|uniref:Putative membrane protein n=1 Tax=Mycobacterium intracellulare 1956 TaxID=1299331 RepID=X8CSF9_MYCIT|nr:putative membrane protein [Mycobacterium intracellulare 1956]
MIWPALGVLLPVARVVALTWLVVAGVAITRAAQRDSSSR